MKRVKTLFKYVLWLVLFFIFSEIMINIGLNTIYNNIDAKSNLSQVNITRAEATHVDGRIYGNINLEENSALIGNYLKVSLYSKRNVLLGIDYIKIEKPENGNVQNIEEHFTYDDVEYYDLSIIDEAQKEKEVAEIMNQSLFSLFDGFKINGMTLGQKIWASIIMVAIFA